MSEREAFEAFYSSHHAAVAGYVGRRVGEEDCGDIVAQVFAVAWWRFDAVPEPPEDRLWLFGVARRMVADHHRSTLRRLKGTEELCACTPAARLGNREATAGSYLLAKAQGTPCEHSTFPSSHDRRNL